MADEFDPFAGSSSLPDKLDILIEESWFEFDPEYADGQTLLFKITGSTTDDTFGEMGRGTLQYSTGSGWEAEDNGNHALREDGNTQKGFGDNCAYQKFIVGAISCDGAEDVLRGEGRGDPRYANMWVGTAWHLDRQETDYGGEIGKRSRLIPTKFLGVGDNINVLANGTAPSAPAKAAGVTKVAPGKAAAPVTKAAGKVAAPVSKAAPAPARAVPGPAKAAAAPTSTPTSIPVDNLPADAGTNNFAGAGISDDLYSRLHVLGYECSTHDQFVERAFNEHDDVASLDADAQQVIMDEGAVWAKIVADYEAGVEAGTISA